MSNPDMIIPGYVYPGAPPRVVWDAWTQAADPVAGIIITPGFPGGPGTFVDTNYVAVIAQAQAAGIRIYGYVDTNYAAVPQGTVQADIDTWKTFYGINDIFFDRTSSGAGDLAYYTAITNYVRSAHFGAQIILNPGTTVDQGYVPLADVICVFEGPMSSYNIYVPDSWNRLYPEKFLHLVYNVPTELDMLSTLDKAKGFAARHVYITDFIVWYGLPAFFSSEVAALTAFLDVFQITPREDLAAAPSVRNFTIHPVVF